MLNSISDISFAILIIFVNVLFNYYFEDVWFLFFIFQSIVVFFLIVQKYNKNKYKIFLFLFIITISPLIVFKNVLNINNFFVESLNQISSYVEESKEVEIELTASKKEIFKKSISLENFDDSFIRILYKVDGETIKILDNNFEVIMERGKSLKESTPFLIDTDGQLVSSGNWWFSNNKLFKLNNNDKEVYSIDFPVHHYASINDSNLIVPSFEMETFKKFKKTEYYERLKDYNCYENSKKFINRPIMYSDEDITIDMPSEYKEDRIIRKDEIIIINYKNGEILDKIDLFDILLKDNVMFNITVSSEDAKCDDIFHLNDVRLLKKIPKKLRSVIPKESLQNQLALLSLRDINTLAIIDLDEKKIIWSVSNLFKNQHSPRVLPNGNILSFDNFALSEIGESKYGFSALTEINPITKEIVARLDSNSSFGFSSQRRGRVQVYGEKGLFVLSSDDRKFFNVQCEPNENVFLRNCNIDLLYNDERDLGYKSIFIMDLYYMDEKGNYNLLN